jgi:hypothetical protein
MDARSMKALVPTFWGVYELRLNCSQDWQNVNGENRLWNFLET